MFAERLQLPKRCCSTRLFAGILLFGTFGGEAAASNQDCLDCHGEKDLEAETERGKDLELFLDSRVLEGSVHEDLDCTDCHGGAKSWNDAPHNDGKPLTLRCGDCHEEALEEYLSECIHGSAFQKKDPRAPWCNDCHGDHRIQPLTSRESRLSSLNQPETCGRCHGSGKHASTLGVGKQKLVERYYSSVHWQSVKEGKPAATCSDCHGSHSMLPSSDTQSHVTRTGLLNVCSKCHRAIVESYRGGSHGRTLLHGNMDVPTCTTCHGDHDMMSLKMQVDGRRNYAGTQICIWCHGNERMMARYDLDTTPVETYMRDFHGLTQRGTAGTSATCADCHDAHHSLPESNPESRIHVSNRGATCGQCHGVTSKAFVMSFTHRAERIERGGNVKEIIRVLYVVLIVATIGGMVLHNLLIWIHTFRRKYKYQKQHAEIVRMNGFERFWHYVLLSSFITLVITGFALKYPNSVWYRWTYSAGLAETVRAGIHRLAAVLMTASMLMFMVYQLVSKTGRRWWTDMLPGIVDLRDFWNTMRYYLNRTKKRPRFGVFGYAEKAEYWALLWGTVIMLMSGLVLWFPKFIPSSWPAWLIDVTRVVHFYEAVLASLAILVWHMFHTIFHPGEYPMDTAWLTGVLTRDEAKHRFTDEAIAAQRPSASPEEEVEPLEKPAWDEDGH